MFSCRLVARHMPRLDLLTRMDELQSSPHSLQLQSSPHSLQLQSSPHPLQYGAEGIKFPFEDDPRATSSTQVCDWAIPFASVLDPSLQSRTDDRASQLLIPERVTE